MTGNKHRFTDRTPKIRGTARNLEARKGITPVMRWLLAPSKDHDAAKRIVDQYTLHTTAIGTASIGQYFAVRLDDGTGDGTLYPTKRDAARHQSRPEFYAYFRIVPGGLDEKDALIFLHFCRDAYNRGARLTDPEDARTMRTRGMPG